MKWKYDYGDKFGRCSPDADLIGQKILGWRPGHYAYADTTHTYDTQTSIHTTIWLSGAATTYNLSWLTMLHAGNSYD